MREVTEEFDVGVVIGRFQVPELHQGHLDLLEHVGERHGKVIVLLGLTPLKGTRRNPLDFEARRQMIQAEFPGFDVAYIKDMPTDLAWSGQVDERVEDLTGPSQSAVLYGARDSFIEHYTGDLPVRELESDSVRSGESVRQEVSGRSTRAEPDFRAGAVWAAFNRFPTVYTCVDVAVFSEDGSKILLGRKQHEKEWRLPGGFSQVGSPSFEADARREVQEETGLSITDPQYVGNFPVPDWRYRGEVDEIRTLLFRAKKFSGSVRAADDLAEARWFNADEVSVADVVPAHWRLLQEVLPMKSER